MDGRVIDALIGAAVEVATDDAWRIEQPSRSVHATVVERARRIPDRLRPWAECVIRRETGGKLSNPRSREDARNPASSAQGRWQFLDISWRQNGGIHFIVSKRLRQFGLPRAAAKPLRGYLSDTPIASWPGEYQDVAFVGVVLSGGWHHWTGAHCDRLAPR